MTAPGAYTLAAVVAVVLAVAADVVVLRTRLLATARWWLAWGIVLVFQLVTNGWLTGRRIVSYAPGAVLGGGEPRLLGDGRLVYAPVEDVGFGFALVLLTCAVWTALGRGGRGRGAGRRPRPGGRGRR